MSLKEICMRRVLTFALVVAAVSCAPSINLEQEKTALMAIDAEWSKTPSDVDKFVSYFAPDATMAMAGAPGMKPAAIKDAFGAMSKAPGYSLTWQATRADVAA